MSPTLRVVALAAVVALATAGSSGRIAASGAEEEPVAVKSTRGGLLGKTARHQFEVFFYASGLRVFPLDAQGSPIDASRLTGTVTFYHPNSPKPWFMRPLHGEAASGSQAQSSVDLLIVLSTVPATGAKATFEIAGLPDASGSTVSFTVPVELVATSASANPAPPPGGAAASPRYVYGPGYLGFGYYQYPGPEAAPFAASVPTVYSYAAPARQGSSGGGATHDWSTGRDYPAGGLISKPWLRPMD